MQYRQAQCGQHRSFIYRVYDLYRDGFRHMRLGKTLWVIVLVKLFGMLGVLKSFVVRNFLEQHAEEGEQAEFVASQV